MRFRSLSLPLVVVFAACISINNDRPRFADPEVAMVMRVSNLGEVREATLAREKAAEPAVRDFASMMVTEHSSANSKQETELMKADIVSEDTELSRQLDAESGAATDRLRQLAGRAFDRAYMQRQVDVHQNVLNLIDTKLVPAAKKKVVKEQLKTMRTTVEQHLTKARQILNTLPAT